MRPDEDQTTVLQSDELHSTESDTHAMVLLVGEHDLVRRERDSQAVRKDHEGTRGTVADNRELRRPVCFSKERRRCDEFDDQRRH